MESETVTVELSREEAVLLRDELARWLDWQLHGPHRVESGRRLHDRLTVALNKETPDAQ